MNVYAQRERKRNNTIFQHINTLKNNNRIHANRLYNTFFFLQPVKYERMKTKMKGGWGHTRTSISRATTISKK